MRWLLKRVLLIWLMLIVLCAAGIEIGKLNRTPDSLQTLRFDICDGEPCFQGIKLGMSWEEARKELPEAILHQGDLVLPMSPDYVAARIVPSSDGTTVDQIIIDNVGLLPTTVGEILVRNGNPCRVYVDHSTMELVFPLLEVIVTGDYAAPYFHLQSNTSPYIIRISKYANERCYAPASKNLGAWQGFTSIGEYLTRYRKPSKNVR